MIAYEIPFSEIDFQVFHVDGEFNGLATYFMVLFGGSALLSFLGHWVESYVWRLRETNPNIQIQKQWRKAVKEISVNGEEDQDLLEAKTVVLQSTVVKESVNVRVFLILSSHIFVQVFAYGLCMCVQGGFISPVPIAAPTWFPTAQAMHVGWITQSLLCTLIPQSICVLVRVYQYRPRMYVVSGKESIVIKTQGKSAENDEKEESGGMKPPKTLQPKAIHHETSQDEPLERVDLIEGAWKRLYAFRCALAE